MSTTISPAAGTTSAEAAAGHPLDPLTAEEISAAVALLRRERSLADDVLFAPSDRLQLWAAEIFRSAADLDDARHSPVTRVDPDDVAGREEAQIAIETRCPALVFDTEKLARFRVHLQDRHPPRLQTVGQAFGDGH
jgi:hypothetical protein